MAVQSMSGDEVLLGKNIFELWEEGAKSIEETSIGKIVTSPVRILEKATGATQQVLTATGQTAAQAPAIAKTLPLILIILAGGVVAYLAFAGKSGVKLTPM